MLSNEEISAIKGRVEKATEGSWECADTYDGAWIVDEYGDIITGTCSRIEDGIFIANSKEDIPKLLSEIDEIRNRLDDAEGLLEDALGDLDDMYLHLHNTKTYDDITEYFEKNEPITGREG